MDKKVKKKTPGKTLKKTVKKKAAGKTKLKKAAKKGTVKVSKSKKTAKTQNPSTQKTAALTRNSAAKSSKTIKKSRKKSTLTAKELAYFRNLLVEKLKQIIGDVNHIENGALKTSRLDSTGDLSSMPIHMADIGSDNYEQEFALGLMDSERKIVQEIYAALERIDRKTYGICEGTGEPIPLKRLEGIPWTRHCVEYAQMLEKGLVSEDSANYDYDQDEPELEQEEYEEDIDDRDMDDYFFTGYNDEEEDEE